jgi:hypothetical protein
MRIQERYGESDKTAGREVELLKSRYANRIRTILFGFTSNNRALVLRRVH